MVLPHACRVPAQLTSGNWFFALLGAFAVELVGCASDDPDALVQRLGSEFDSDQPGPKACDACTQGEDCPKGGGCVSLSGGPRFCTSACSDHDDCTVGFNCLDLGEHGKQCIPDTGACSSRSGQDDTPVDLSFGDSDNPEALRSCEELSTWPDAWQEFEQEVLLLVNQSRREGTTCGSTDMPSVSPLSLDPNLTCAARGHSLDMAERDFFEHENPDGLSPADRIANAGYDYLAAGENIAKGQRDPEDVMDSWLASPGHCTNIMGGSFTQIGIGYYLHEAADTPRGGRAFWTQNFGRPR